eukprot:scaffold2600_cov73-Cyclotella_meneghiniana.AAC.4
MANDKKLIRNSSLASKFSYINSNGNTLNSSEPTTVAILSVFGLIAIGAALGGICVIHRRSSSSILNKRDGNAHFKEFHSEDALDSEQSVCASDPTQSPPTSDLGEVLDIESSDSSTSMSSNTLHALYITQTKNKLISPINGFDIPASPAPDQFDMKCFTYSESHSLNTTSSPKVKINVDNPKDELSSSSSTDSGEKIAHLLGYNLSEASSSIDDLELCVTESSVEDV